MNNLKEKLSDFFFNENTFSLSNHKVFQLIGEETREYLQRQLTVDLKGFVDSAGLACRLDRTGRVFSFFYLINKAEKFYVVVDEKIAQETKEELEKFIIMEDIEVKELESFANISTKNKAGYVPVTLFDGQAYINIEDAPCEETITSTLLEEFISLSSWPVFNFNVFQTDLVNETRLNEFAVSYNKGCFLGQETASKIESRRGAPRYPILVISKSELDDFVVDGKKVKVFSRFKDGEFFIHSCKAPRDFLINELDKKIDDIEIKFLTYPIAEFTKDNISEVFFHKAVDLFHAKEIEAAIDLLDKLIEYNPLYADAYETKGVILGNSGRHEDAINVMDELLKVDENSVMAHTNKSLYLMKLGKIEEAEEEKAQATVASFKRFGDEAAAKKAKEEQERAEKEDRARRFEMFNKVLAIDEVDVVANFGLADIHFNNENYKKATKHIDIVLNENPKYSVAYLLKSKILFKQKDYKECLELVEKGIPIATSQGELMPANEMQSLKAKILRL